MAKSESPQVLVCSIEFPPFGDEHVSLNEKVISFGLFCRPRVTDVSHLNFRMPIGHRWSPRKKKMWNSRRGSSSLKLGVLGFGVKDCVYK